MAEFAQGAPYVGAPFPEVEFYRRTATLTLPASGFIAFGELVCRDITQLSSLPSWVAPATVSNATGSPVNSPPAGYTPQTDMVVPSKNANAGLPYGILVGTPTPPTATAPYKSTASVVGSTMAIDSGAAGAPSAPGLYNPTSANATITVNVAFHGYVSAWCKVAASGTAITVGSKLVVSAANVTNDLLVSATFTSGLNAGLALATVVSGSLISGVGSSLLATGVNAGYLLTNVDLRFN